MPDETKPGAAARLLDALDAVAQAFAEYRLETGQLPHRSGPWWEPLPWDVAAWRAGAAEALAKFDAARDAVIGSEPLEFVAWMLGEEAALDLKALGAPVTALAAIRDATNWLRVACSKALTGTPMPPDLGESYSAPAEGEERFTREGLLLAEYSGIRAALAWHIPGEPMKPSEYPLPTIWRHGPRSFSADRRNPIVVPEVVAAILEAFLDRAGPMTTQELEVAAGYQNPRQELSRFVRKHQGTPFAEAVRMPGGKGGGGYFVRVARA
jgi:hypothetical protein